MANTNQPTTAQTDYLASLTASTLFDSPEALAAAVGVTLDKGNASALIDALKTWRNIHPSRRQPGTTLAAIQDGEDAIALTLLTAEAEARGIEFDPEADLFWDHTGWGVETDDFEMTLTRTSGTIATEVY